MADGGDLLLATRFGWKKPSYRASSIQKLQRQCTWWQCLGRKSLEIPSQSLARGMWLFFLYVLRSSRNRSDPTRDGSKRMKPSRKKQGAIIKSSFELLAICLNWHKNPRFFKQWNFLREKRGFSGCAVFWTTSQGGSLVKQFCGFSS